MNADSSSQTYLQWDYDRDDCWGARGEPLLTGRLVGEDLILAVRNSRECGLEIVVFARHHQSVHKPDDGPVLKVGFEDQSLRIVAGSLSESGDAYFVEEPLGFLADLQCANRVRIRARSGSGVSWFKLDADYADFDMRKLVEPGAGILYQVRPNRLPRKRPGSTPAVPAVPSGGVAQLAGAALPLIGLAAGYKAGYALTGPKRKS